MVHIIFDGSDLKLDHFSSGQIGGGISYFEGLPPKFQRGYGFFAGYPRQRGYGIRSIFKSLLRFLKPVGSALAPMAKEAGKMLAQEGVSTGAKILSDIAEGKNAKEALAENSREGVARLLNKASTKLQSGSGLNRNYRRTRKIPGTHIAIKPGDVVIPRSILGKKRSHSRNYQSTNKPRKMRIDALGLCY